MRPAIKAVIGLSILVDEQSTSTIDNVTLHGVTLR